MVGLPQGDSPFLLDSSYTITADINVPQPGAKGSSLKTSGRRFVDMALPAQGQTGIPVEHGRSRIASSGKVRRTGAGKHTVEFDFKYDGLGVGTLAYNNLSGLGQPGTGTLKVDGKVVASSPMKHTLPMILQWDEASTSAPTR